MRAGGGCVLDGASVLPRELIRPRMAGCIRGISGRVDDAVLGEITLNLASKELGIWLGVPFWRQGYASEALLRLMQVARADLRMTRVHALIQRGNVASCALVEKCGFGFSGLEWQQTDSGKLPFLKYLHHFPVAASHPVASFAGHPCFEP